MSEKAASLTVLGGPFAGTRCVLPESGTVTIGSAPGSLLRLDLPTVSPFHARIAVDAGRVTVHDTGAERTVHVNDNPLEPGGTVLRNGDILWLGAPGEDDVVMLQCILPRRPAEAPPPVATPDAPAFSAESPGPATPTPEIETTALWTTGPEAPAAARVAAEPVREEATGTEETMAILPEGVASGEGPPLSAPAEDEALIVAEASLPGATEEEMVAAVEVAEPAAFVEDSDAVVVEASEIEPAPSPTLLVTSPDEVAEPQPVAIDFSDTAAIEPEVVPPPPPVAAPEPPVFAPAPPPPPAEPVAPPAAAKPSDSAPPVPVARPAAPARPASPRPSPRPGHPSASTPSPRRDVRHPAPPPRPAPPPPAEPKGVAGEPAPPAGRPRAALLAVGGFAAVLVVAGLGWVAWRVLAGRPSGPAPTPPPVAEASTAPATLPPPLPTTADQPTPEPVAAPTPTPPPVVATPRPGTTPTPTPTPSATPTPAAVRATPTPPPAAPGPSAEALRAQQAAAQVPGAPRPGRDGDRRAAVRRGRLAPRRRAARSIPANARATGLRADAVRRRDLAKRRFVPGQTAVQTQKAQKGGDLAGFDTGDADLRKAPDFLGRVEFEMSPASGLEAGDAWTLRVYVVNEGKKPIRVQGVTVGTTVNGAGGGGPVAPRAREIAPQQRSLVAEATGSWRDGTTAWSTEATITAGKGDSLRNTLTWR